MKNLLVIGTILLLVLAILGGDFDYGFFTLVRLVVSGTAIYLAWKAHEINKGAWIWVFGTTAVTFNPILPLSLGRDIWVLVDILTVGILITFVFRFKDFKTE